MKINYMGRQVNGRFYSFKTAVRRFVRKMLYWFLAVVPVTLLLTSILSTSNVSATNVDPQIVDRTPQTAAELKEDLAALIRKGETHDVQVKEGDIFHTFDPSKKMASQCMQTGGRRPVDCESYGVYQEKLGTIQYYAKQVYGHDVTQMEAFAIANDTEKAKDFLLKCSIEVEGCVWNWTAALNNRPYVEVMIPLIRKLEK